ncbi:hypothetical protein FA421_01020 [Pseudomonas aeruginosa]|nr:hypothetical protein [Pseudomonas aeruginosa]
MKLPKLLAALALLAAPALAFAHPGHGEHGLVAGLAHPLTGLDHLLFALAHGVAHGLELPDLSSPWLYALGFVAATAALHAAGYALVRFLPQAAAPLVRLAGLASAGAGVWLLAG